MRFSRSNWTFFHEQTVITTTSERYIQMEQLIFSTIFYQKEIGHYWFQEDVTTSHMYVKSYCSKITNEIFAGISGFIVNTHYTLKNI